MSASPSDDLTSGGGVAGADVAVIIVNYRTPELTKACLTALSGERALLPKLRVIVVDGGSGDGSAGKLATTVAGAQPSIPRREAVDAFLAGDR